MGTHLLGISFSTALPSWCHLSRQESVGALLVQLGCCGAGKEERIDLLFRDVLTSCPKYHMLLARIWEGIILEYWRGLGKEIKVRCFCCSVVRVLCACVVCT